jgi:hypothetical protein
MANQSQVVDELVVKLKLDTKEYDRADKTVNTKVEKTAGMLSKLGKGVAFLATAVAGMSAAIVTLVNFEARMRRLAVATGLSNRAMQAWGSTARRLGGDAESGRQAIADLAREQKTFQFTGSAPTLTALARLGVRAGPGVSVTDMLAQAQQIYRGSSAGQRENIEAGLSAQGVSDDLILMIKSEKDVREQYTKSYKESADENRKALDAIVDKMETANNASIKVTAKSVDVAYDATNAVVKGLHVVADELQAFAGKVKQFFSGAGDSARPNVAFKPAQNMSGSARGAMHYLITKYGLTVDQAAGVVANLQKESGLNPNATFKEANGDVSIGIGQWNGSRKAALLASGAKTVEQQLDFMFSNPDERARMKRALAAGGNAGFNVSRIYESPLDPHLDKALERSRLADRYASDYRRNGAPTVGQQINVQNMTVQADNPAQLGQQMKRQAGAQNYAAGNR